MPGSDFKTISCVYCDWSGRTHRIPSHVLIHHPEQIVRYGTQYDHCLHGTIGCDTNRIEFAVCLTCKKGVVGSTRGGNGARWISMHSRSDACRTAHASAFAGFTGMPFEPIPILFPIDYTPPSEPDPPEPIPELIPPPSDTTGTSGWIYCFENDCMPGIYKVGVTRRTPEKRLAEANSSSTWSSPTPFRSILTKQTAEAFSAEKAIHRRLSEMGYRVHPRREFFNAPLEVIQSLFIEIG
jgi:hypothetical protein